MNYDQGLHLVVYELAGRPEEREIIMGTNGTTHRSERGGWTKKGRYILPGTMEAYMETFFGEKSIIRPLIKESRYIGGTQLFVGRPESGIQFTIPASTQQAFVKIVEAMLLQK